MRSTKPYSDTNLARARLGDLPHTGDKSANFSTPTPLTEASEYTSTAHRAL